MKKPYKEIINYIYFFLLVAFVTTCTIVLFMDILMKTLGYEFTQEEITKSAVSTFLLVLFISLSFATIDYIRRIITVIRIIIMKRRIKRKKIISIYIQQFQKRNKNSRSKNRKLNKSKKNQKLIQSLHLLIQFKFLLN